MREDLKDVFWVSNSIIAFSWRRIILQPMTIKFNKSKMNFYFLIIVIIIINKIIIIDKYFPSS